jgi:hypothetical protein
VQYSTPPLSQARPKNLHLLKDMGRPSALAKAAIVMLLSWLLAWRPRLALALGRLVLRVWPGFRRA